MTLDINTLMYILLSFYLRNTPHPNIHFVDALQYLANDFGQCSPNEESYEYVEHNVRLFLKGITPEECK